MHRPIRLKEIMHPLPGAVLFRGRAFPALRGEFAVGDQGIAAWPLGVQGPDRIRTRITGRSILPLHKNLQHHSRERLTPLRTDTPPSQVQRAEKRVSYFQPDGRVRASSNLTVGWKRAQGS